MSGRPKTVVPSTSKNLKHPPRQSTVNVASPTRFKAPPTITRPKVSSRSKIKENTTLVNDCDTTKASLPDTDTENPEIAYGRFLRAMLEDCLLDEKIEREQTQMDIQMAQLTDRFQKSIDQLDKTHRRLKDISFVVEQKRLLDLKTQECAQFYEMTEKSKAEEIFKNLSVAEHNCLDQLKLKNVDFGYNKDSGHKQLLDAVTDAIEGLEEIKKHSNLDVEKFKEYERSQKNLEDIERDKFNIESLKAEFEAKFPKFSEELIKQASEKIGDMMEADEDSDDD